MLGLSLGLERSTVSPECVQMWLDSLRINARFSDKSVHLTSQSLVGRQPARFLSGLGTTELN